MTITTAVPGVPARISIPSETTINQVPTCTRFQIDGQNIVLHDLIFDQSQCNLLGAVSQTPIVFSGAFASSSRIFNITVIDSSAAVAVLGGNSIVYTFVPLIEANGLMIDDVRFEYDPLASFAGSLFPNRMSHSREPQVHFRAQHFGHQSLHCRCLCQGHWRPRRVFVWQCGSSPWVFSHRQLRATARRLRPLWPRQQLHALW